MLMTLQAADPVMVLVQGPGDDSARHQSDNEQSPAQHDSGGNILRPLTAELKSQYLQKVTGSRTFLRATQLQRLLQFLGSRALTDAGSVTEYDVAVEVLHRRAEFDPRSDSLVRKEMSRLRSKLAEYYASEGGRDSVVIQCGGPYKLDFRWREGWTHAGSRTLSRCLLVLPATPAEADKDFADRFYDELLLKLSSVTGCRVVSRTSARYYATQSKDIRDISSQCGADSVIEIDIRRSGEELVLLLWLVDGVSGFIRSTLTLRGEYLRMELSEWAVNWLLREGVIPETGNVQSQP